jgi:hypothetical protein
MRHSNQDLTGRRLPRLAVLVALLAVVLTACGSSQASPGPSSSPTPVPTPDPHLQEPVTADQVYGILTGAKVPMNCPNLGNGNPAIVKQINCNLAGWPLRITQYKTSAVLARAMDWKAGQAPAGEEAPYGFAGLNVLIQFGPISARAPSAPDSARQAQAASIIAILDPLLWPIAQHSVVAIPSRTPEPTPSPSLAASAAPAKSAKPSKSP